MRPIFLLIALAWAGPALAVDADVERVAADAVQREAAAIDLLADLVRIRSVHEPGLDNADHPEFKKLTARLRQAADELGFDFRDFGAVVVVGWGDAEDRLGLVTHGDVQPADPRKWAADPFSLDLTSEPGRMVGRGTEDDKGPIALALHAMAAVRESGRRPTRRVELVVSYTEESDWDPFRAFLETYPMPPLNVALDAGYPVVTGEKGWCLVSYGYRTAPPSGEPDELLSLTGGSFLSQVPEDGQAVIARPSPELMAALEQAQKSPRPVKFSTEVSADGALTLVALGKSAHSSMPEEGHNAIAYLVDLLAAARVTRGPAAPVLRYLQEMVGTGTRAENFGDVAYQHDFMGPLTLNLSTVTQVDGLHVANLNFRRPAGRTNQEFTDALAGALAGYEASHGPADSVNIYVTDPHLVEGAPHVDALLDIFSHFTGDKDAAAIAIGGGTHARLVPNGVNFGPAMPGVEYTGHSEHEYITRDQFRLNLKMYAAMLATLATETRSEMR